MPESLARPKILLDCDPGQDDAIAIVCAAAFGDLVSITTVSGNVPLHRSTTNALLVTQIADLDVEVHAGSDRPLVAAPTFADHGHGPTGLDGPNLPPLARRVASEHAVDHLIEMAADDVHLVPTGPLTNVARALERDPKLLDRYAGVTLMGGSAGPGNVTATAEFNVWVDPEAAAAVFATGAPITMVGLNLTHQVRMGAAHAAELRRRGGGACAAMVADILDFYSGSSPGSRAAGGAAIHDACAVLAVTHPELFVTETRAVAVEVDGHLTRGMTVVDERGADRRHDDDVEGNPNVAVAYRVDAPAAIELIMKAALIVGPD